MSSFLRSIFLATLLFPTAAFSQIREEYRPLSELLSTRPEREPTEGNLVEIIPCGAELFLRMQDDMMAAEKTLHSSYFIFNDDEAGFLVRTAFRLKAMDGVEVQYIAEDFNQKASFVNPMRKSGVEVRHHPLLPLTPRNHHKYLLIDGVLAYAGGNNISNDNILEWEDWAVRLRGPVVASMEQVHARMWERRRGKASEYEIKEEEPFDGGVTVQYVDDVPGEKSRLHLKAYIWALDHAREYFYAKSPYFTPPKEFMRSLVDAARRGVDVRILIPAFKDAPSRVVVPFERAFFEELVQAGVHIHLRKDRFDHSKMFSCDNYLSAMGSVNLDALSFSRNFENNLYIYDEKISAEIKRSIEEDLVNCYELTPELLDDYPAFEKAMKGPLRRIGGLF